MKNRTTILALAAILVTVQCAAGVEPVGPYDFQTFSSPTWQNTFTSGNVTRDDWQLVDGYVNMNALFNNPFVLPKSPHSADIFDCAVWLTTVNSALISPQLSDGMNVISFYANISASGSSDFDIQSSPNGVDSWSTLTSVHIAAQGWQEVRHTNNTYNGLYIRILQTAESPAGQYLGLDDILITRPPAYVTITDVAVDPADPIIGTPIDIRCQIADFSDVSGLVVTSFWQVGTTGPWTAIPMQIDGSDYVTATKIPGQSPLQTLLRYYIVATYDGTDNMSPTYYPPGGAASPTPLVYRQPVFYSAYTNVYLTGSVSADMALVDDYRWQKVVTVGTLVDAPFKFEGTNAGGITVWGENDQPFTTMPVFGTVESGGGNIVMGGSNSGHILFAIDETVSDYSAQLCEFVDFDSWSGADTFGTYTNAEGWVISDCRTTTGAAADLSRVFGDAGKSCIMDEDAGPQYIRSPYLPDGVGEIGFWYRNWETNGASPTEFYVQVSPNAGGPWTTVSHIDNMRALDYLRFSHVRSDVDNHYVRILRGTNQNARLCIDGLVVAEPGPGVEFAAPTTAPTTPDVMSTVNISAVATLRANASNPDCTLWYRYNTNVAFKPITMTAAGLTFTTDTAIPRMPIGSVQYYIECTFNGISSTERITTYHPTSGSDAPLTYSVIDWSITQRFPFPPWANTYTSGNTLQQNWLLTNGYVNMNALYNNPFTLPKSTQPANNLDSALWLTATNSALSSTVAFNYGVGTVDFWANNAGPGTNSFSIQIATSALGPWTTVASSEQTAEVWTRHVFEVNEPDPTYIRILKTGETGGGPNGQFMGIDDVTITLPPATVRITNPMIHPGYPASNEAVTVSCNIDSANPTFRAFNIAARMWYRTGGSGPFSSIDMTGTGSNYFATAGTIPALPTGTEVEYYVESMFDGYAHTPADNHSPTFLPGGISHATNTQYYVPPQSGFLNYTVRRYMSDYNVLQLSGTTSFNLEQQDDRVWQGIIDFGIDGVTNPVLYLSGLAQYTGSNYWPSADTWADLYQTRTQVPMYNVMYPGETNALTMPGVQSGQFVFRFDEANLTYILQRCTFQDFDVWYADDTEFQESWSFGEELVITTNDFNNWPLTSYSEWPIENFQTWGVMPNYSVGQIQGGVGWYINSAKIIGQFDNDKACQLRDNDIGFPYVCPTKESPCYGIGSFDFEYRCVNTNHHPTLYWGATNWGNSIVSATLRATDVPVNESGYSFGNCSISLYSRYVSPESYYELRVEQTGLGSYALRLYRKSGPGAPTLVKNWDTGWGGRITAAHHLDWITRTAGSGKVDFEVWWDYTSMGSYYENGTALTGATGAFGIDATDADIAVRDVSGGYAQLQYFNNWWNTTSTNTSTNQAWVAKYCYINADYARFRDPTPDDGAYVRSPLLPHGLSRIRFDHKDDGSSSHYYKFKVQWSSNDVDWTTITDYGPRSGNWTTYDKVTNIAVPNIYVRVRVDSTSDYGFSMDQMSIRPNYNLPGTLYEDFDDDEAQDWTDMSGGYWYVTNSAYCRPGYTATPVQFEVQTATYDKYNQYPADYVCNTYTSFVGRTQTHYESVSIPIEQSGANEGTRVAWVKIRPTGGGGSLIVDNLFRNNWHGKNVVSTNNGWRAYEAWMVQEAYGSETNRYVDLRVSRAYEDNYNGSGPNGRQRIRTASLTNGIGTVQFRTSRYGTLMPRISYEYFEGSWTGGGYLPDFDSLTPVTSGDISTFNLSPRLRDTDFAFRYTGKIRVPSSGDYTFYTYSDDGSQLFIDGSLLVNNDGPHGMIEQSGAVTLAAGYHDIVVTFCQGGGGYGLTVSWEGPALAKQEIPAAVLYNYDVSAIPDAPPCVYEVRYADSTNWPTWTLLRTYTNDTKALPEWQTHSVAVNTNVAGYIEIVNISTNPGASLLVDDIIVTGFSARDEFNWVVYNGLVTDLQTDRIWLTGRNPIERTAYINNTMPAPLTNYEPHVQSPRMSMGIGEISFWYRNWTEAPTTPATLHIMAAPAYTLPEEEWTELATITNFATGEWSYFRELFYDSTNRFVRFYADLAPGDRICLDDVLIMNPLGADLTMTNMVTVPAIPLVGQPINVRIDLAQYLLDVNVTNAELRYVVGTSPWATWNPGNVIKMSQVANNPALGSYTWQTDTPIPAQAIDATVQYYVYCEFDGRFADRGGSPKTYRAFTNPSHYYPVDYNVTYGVPTNRIPYYIVFSCLPGAVWFNELNLCDTDTVWDNEYVELCGPAGTDISGWKVELRDENAAVHKTYVVPPGTVLPDDKNGYGFWVLGDSGVANVDMVLDKLYEGGLDEQHFPYYGSGMRLSRSMGSDEYKIYYNAIWEVPYYANHGYERLNYYESLWEDNSGSLQLEGSGSAYTDFTWQFNANHRPGAENLNQNLVPDGVSILITQMSLLPGTIEIRYTQSGGGSTPAPWYSTNLLAAEWSAVTTYTGPVEENGTNVITFDLPVDVPCYFYRLTTP